MDDSIAGNSRHPTTQPSPTHGNASRRNPDVAAPLLVHAADRARAVEALVRSRFERTLHPVRRRIATRRVARSAPIESALFVCSGNLCRSPFAAAAFVRAMGVSLGGGISVGSAGFIPSGRHPPSAALAAASRRQLDMSRHRATLINRGMVGAAGLIVVMETEHRSALRRRVGVPRGPIIVLGDLDPQSVYDRAVRDPMGGDDAMFDATYDRIQRCVDALVRALFGVEDTR